VVESNRSHRTVTLTCRAASAAARGTAGGPHDHRRDLTTTCASCEYSHMANSTLPRHVKEESERIIRALGGDVLDGLPRLDRTLPREPREVADRALVMNALLQIYFGAPINVIDAWITSNDLRASLSRRESQILRKSNAELSEQEKIDLYWYVESLWTLTWAGALIADIPIAEPVGDDLASLLPNLQVGETPARFRAGFSLRPFPQIYQMLDLYYRAHWYARDGQLRGRDTGVFDIDIIMERRKALEWLCDRQIADWDEAPDHT